MTARAPLLYCPTCTAPLRGFEDRCPTCAAPLGGFALAAGSALEHGRYTLEGVLGQGGFGITYAAGDATLGREVAVKELFPEGASRLGEHFRPPTLLGLEGFRAALKSFLEEGRVLAAFTHPGIVRVYDAFEENGTAYLVMERLRGETLEARLEREGRLTPAEVQRIALEVGDALSVVHAAGLLHRDLKPDNLFLEAGGRTVLIDFGSARSVAFGHTVAMTRMVTQGYAPPEQYATQAKFGPYTDLYALGATLYHALSGVLPPTATDRMLGTPLIPLRSLVPALERPEFAALERAIMRALELRVEHRPQSVREFLGMLRAGAPAPSVGVARAPESTAWRMVPPPPPPQPAAPARPPATVKPSVYVYGLLFLAFIVKPPFVVWAILGTSLLLTWVWEGLSKVPASAPVKPQPRAQELDLSGVWVLLAIGVFVVVFLFRFL